MEGHRPVRVVIILFTTLVLVLTLVLNSFAAGTGQQIGLFLNTTGQLSDRYFLEITPAGWTFTIWAVIYVWQALWMVYALTTICRHTSYGYLYVNPPVMPPSLYIFFSLNLGFNIGWIFLWDRQYIVAALVFIIGIWMTLATCLVISLRGLYQYGAVYIREETVKDVWAVRLLVQNGLGIYFGWTMVATLLNLGVVVTYHNDLRQEVASTICLSLLLMEILVLFFLDVLVLDKFTRYLITPYMVFVFALSGSLAKSWTPEKSNPVFAASILAMASLLLVVKAVVMLVRHFQMPIWSRANVPSSFFEKKPSYGSNEQSGYVKL